MVLYARDPEGLIHRVFLSGPIYGGKRFYDQGGLAGRKAWVTATLGGREHMFGPDAIHGEIKDMLRPLLQGALAYAGLEVLEPFFGYHIPYLDQSAREATMRDFHHAVDTLNRARRCASRNWRILTTKCDLWRDPKIAWLSQRQRVQPA